MEEVADFWKNFRKKVKLFDGAIACVRCIAGRLPLISEDWIFRRSAGVEAGFLPFVAEK
ncbi:MAG TPA: hypothetical protein VF214_05740 [Edaphobacter sp.]